MNNVKHKVVYKVKGGSWNNGSKKPLIEYVEDNGTLKNVPNFMVKGFGHKQEGSWNKNPYEASIKEDTTFVFKFKTNPVYPTSIGAGALVLLLALILFLPKDFNGDQNKILKVGELVAENGANEDINFDDIEANPIVTLLNYFSGNESNGAQDGGTAFGDAIQKYSISVEVNDAVMGSALGSGTYERNTSITLTAIANDGYVFVSWNDGNTDATRKVTVLTNATYTARFAVDNSALDKDPVDPPTSLFNKGDIIYFAENPSMKYRVMKVDLSSNTALVVSRDNVGQSKFILSGKNSNVYANSELDNFMERWYHNLPEGYTKNAIVLTDISQSIVGPTDAAPGSKYLFMIKGVESGNHYVNYYASREIGPRYVFALDILDYAEYFGTTEVSINDLLDVVNNPTSVTIWTRSAANSSDSPVSQFFRYGTQTYFYDKKGATQLLYAYPAFYIDLLADGIVLSE